MSKKKLYILGIDLGTSSLKTVLYTQDMQQLYSVRREYVSPGGETVTANHWWKALLKALSELGESINLSDIVCISFSGYNAFVGVNRELNPVTPVILYYHTAPSLHMKELFSVREQNYVFERSCTNMFGSGIMAPGIRWLRDHYPNAYNSTDCFLFSNGFITAKLTGRCTIDASRASLTALHDPRGSELTWDKDLCSFFNVDVNKLPDILNCWELSGRVSEHAASLTGLSAGTLVITGSMDSLCAALGNGITDDTQMLDIGGSAGGLACVSQIPRVHKRLYLSRYVLPGRWCNNAPLMSSARLFDWFMQNLAPGWNMDQYMKAAEHAPCFSRGLTFLPYVGGSRYPYWSMDTAGHFLHFSPECTIEDMARSVMEGLSCAYRSILEDLNLLGLPCPRHIVAAGGDTRFHTWIQSKANYLRIPYHLTDTPEVSAKGAALLAAGYMEFIPDLTSWLDAHTGRYTALLPEEPEEKFLEHYQSFQKDCRLLYQNISNADS